MHHSIVQNIDESKSCCMFFLLRFHLTEYDVLASCLNLMVYHVISFSGLLAIIDLFFLTCICFEHILLSESKGSGTTFNFLVPLLNYYHVSCEFNHRQYSLTSNLSGKVLSTQRLLKSTSFIYTRNFWATAKILVWVCKGTVTWLHVNRFVSILTNWSMMRQVKR